MPAPNFTEILQTVVSIRREKFAARGVQIPQDVCDKFVAETMAAFPALHALRYRDVGVDYLYDELERFEAPYIATWKKLAS